MRQDLRANAPEELSSRRQKSSDNLRAVLLDRGSKLLLGFRLECLDALTSAFNASIALSNVKLGSIVAPDNFSRNGRSC
jgi:hypothetical protein